MEGKKYLKIFVEAIMDPEFGRSEDMLRQFPDNPNVVVEEENNLITFDLKQLNAQPCSHDEEQNVETQ